MRGYLALIPPQQLYWLACMHCGVQTHCENGGDEGIGRTAPKERFILLLLLLLFFTKFNVCQTMSKIVFNPINFGSNVGIIFL